MKPAEKAKELVQKFTEPTQQWDADLGKWIDDLDLAKQCTIICVDEILGHSPMSPVEPGEFYELTSDRIDDAVDYWLKVKEEITKL